MSSSQSQASEDALARNRSLAEGYYGIAIPGLQERMGSINTSLARGEPEYMKQAYQEQRTGLTEGLAARGGVAQAQRMAGSKAAMSGGNQFASMHPADVGTLLANALYGSKFQEGQGALDQSFNLINMGLGGAGTAGSAAVNASGQQLGAIGYMPNYNPAAANIFGAAAGASSVFGALNTQYPQFFGAAGTTNTGATLPTGWSSSGVVGGTP